MHSLWLRRRQAGVPETPLPELRKTYIEERVDDQMRYFQTKHSEAARRQKALSLSATVSTWAAILLGTLLAFHELHFFNMPGLGEKPAELFAIMLPILSAALLHITVGREYGRREARNREMLRELARTRTRIAHAETPRRFEELVAETETLLLVELFEWQTYARFGSAEH